MLINGTQSKSYTTQAGTRRSSKRATPPKKTDGTGPKRDTVEISGASEATKTREAHLAAIRKKVAGGFYDSREVVDDLSDSFAKAFDQALR